MILNEAIVEIVENAALEWFGALGYACLGAEALAPATHGERASYGEVILVGRLRAALRRLNPTMPEEAREEALRKVLLLRDGVPVEYSRPDGGIAGDHARLVDFGEVAANDWLVVNQFTVIEGGLPLALIELKNAADEDTTIWSAYAQLQTYKAEIPNLLHYNGLLVVSDGLQARMGSVTASQEWFKVWRTIAGEGPAGSAPALHRLRGRPGLGGAA